MKKGFVLKRNGVLKIASKIGQKKRVSIKVSVIPWVLGPISQTN